MKIDGYEKLMKQLGEFTDITEKGVEKGLQKVSLRIVADAKVLCKNQTNGKGPLAASIAASVKKTKAQVGTNLEYAPYVELGTGLFAANGNGRKDVPWRYKDAKGKWHTTSGQHPKPFLQPAVDVNKANIEKDVREAVKSALKELK